MIVPHAYSLFVLAALVLLLTPGPAVLFVVARSVQQGRSAGMASTLGLCGGGLVHVVAAIVGLSALLATSATAFSALKLAGAGYLIFLGVRALRNGGPPDGSEPKVAARSMRRHVVDGFVVNVLNPKPAIFFLAFLPQFVDPSIGSPRLQLAILGVTFVILALLTDAAYVMAASSMRRHFIARPRFAGLGRYVSAAVYFGLGIAAATAGRRVD